MTLNTCVGAWESIFILYGDFFHYIKGLKHYKVWKSGYSLKAKLHLKSPLERFAEPARQSKVFADFQLSVFYRRV